MKQPRTVKKNLGLKIGKTAHAQDYCGGHQVDDCKKPDDVPDPNLTAIIENLNGYLWNIDRDRKYIVFNTLLKNKVKEIFGVDIQKGDNAIGILESFAPSKKKEWEELYELGFQGRPHRDTHEFNLYSSPFYLDISLNAIKENGEITGVSCFARDVTDQVLKQKKLNEAEGRFRRLIENSHDGICLLGTDGKFTYVTPSVKRILGYEIEEMEGLDPIAITHPEDRGQFITALKNPGTRPGETVIGTYRILHKNGSWRWLNANITNLLHEPGIQAIVFNYKDITERIEAVENLSKSEANLRSILENTGTGLLLLDKAYKIVAFNHQAAEWIKWESGQQLNENSYYFDYVPLECREEQNQNLALVLQEKKLQYQLQGKKIEGKAKWYTIQMHQIVEDNDEPIGICISICDITERKEVDAIIRDSEELYRSLFNNSPLPKWVCDQQDLRYLEVNDTAVVQYGYSREEFLTLTAFDLRDKKDHDELNRLVLLKGDCAYKSGKVQHIKKKWRKDICRGSRSSYYL